MWNVKKLTPGANTPLRLNYIPSFKQDSDCLFGVWLAFKRKRDVLGRFFAAEAAAICYVDIQSKWWCDCWIILQRKISSNLISTLFTPHCAYSGLWDWHVALNSINGGSRAEGTIRAAAVKLPHNQFVPGRRWDNHHKTINKKCLLVIYTVACNRRL